jgi:UDP-glucose:(heptosyl)LPS alpha-1,3-glucosyltransferase
LFLLVGSGYARKGVAAALTALSRLPGNTHLLVVGRDKALGHYKRLARKLGVASRVGLVGAQDDPKPFYGAADVFVLPTLYDPCPNAALEAMACGLPVVTSTRCGAAELVVQHDAGFVCESGDLDALSAHMGALTDPQARTGRGERARAAVLALTPDAMTLQLVLLYRDLLAAAHAARTEPPKSAAL